ncbi:MAG: U32 family peptidase [Clostridiales bacterium]|nr:U32 family peptidase [Clostridiales bacterium]
MNKPELLSPAGDFESLKAAALYGADAVYIGGDLLQLRAKKAGFAREDIALAAQYLHERGKKLYVTVNAFANNDEIPACGEYARFLRDAGADAAIISDLGVMAEFKKAAPELDIHVSTQANCMNYATAQVYKALGARRIVLAREMTVEQIRALREKLDPEVELEAFVHGAMCMAYSGRCIISSYLTGRSGNRGECTQSCRWSYALMEEKRPGEYFPVEEEDGFTTVLSSHDLCAVDLLSELRDAGVASFKIEGRMKTAYYVATVVNAYRRALDGTMPLSWCREELERIQHRPYATGFYHGEIIRNHHNDGQYIQQFRFMANVLDCKDGVLKLRQRNNFRVGDVLEVLSPRQAGLSFQVTDIRSEDGESMAYAPHPNQILYVPCPFELADGDMLRRKEE